jgi:PAS domain S-box-containing protein
MQRICQCFGVTDLSGDLTLNHHEIPAPSPPSDCGLTAARIRAMDWSRTPIGPIENWPESLRVAVDLCLIGRFPMHVWWGKELTYIYNDAHIPVLGKRHPDALGRPAAEVWAEVWPMLVPQVEAVMLRGESTWNDRAYVVLERNGFREDGWFTWSYSPIRDEAGRIAGLMCIAVEDTARVLAERERDRLEARQQQRVEETRAKLAAIVESSDDAVIGKTLQGIITTWNSGAERIFGYTAAEAVGQHIAILIPPERHDEEANILARLAQGERVEHFETARITKHGQKIDVSLSVSPIKNSAGEIVGASKIVRDITARKRTEASLALHAEELARSNVELERFAYVASHDLQEPIRTVQRFAQLLQRSLGKDLKGDAQEFLDFMIGGVQRMQTLINDLLAYSRAGWQGAAFAPADCNEICAKVLKNLQASIESHQAMVTVDPLPVVIGDATQLGQMFQNLLINAIKFRGQRTPRIHVSVEESPREWIFSVADNGIGIAPEYFERIFVMFQRLHTIEEYAGTGIGLTICKKIAERHEGRIWVRSIVGEGSTFHFSVLKRDRGT